MVNTHRALINITLKTPKTSIVFNYFLIFFNAVFLQSVTPQSSVKPSNALTGPADDIFPTNQF